MNIPDQFPLPSEEEWQRSAEVGERLVRRALGERMMRRLQRGQNPVTNYAIAFGALREVLGLMKALSRPEAIPAVEKQVMVYARGALRGAATPLNEDGTPFTGSEAAQEGQSPSPAPPDLEMRLARRTAERDRALEAVAALTASNQELRTALASTVPSAPTSQPADQPAAPIAPLDPRGDERMVQAIQAVETILPGHAVALVVAPFGGGRRGASYVGNAQRDDIRKLLKVVLAQWEATHQAPRGVH